MARIIGFSGYARSGKDEAAKILVEEYGFKQIAFADKLREVLYALNPIVQPERKYIGPTVYVQDVINEYGWGGYKETPFGTEIRRLLQRLGTEAGRELLGQDIWVNAALDGLDANAKVCITDVRFPNEANAVSSRGGLMVRITRSGVGPVNAHASEIALDEHAMDVNIQNDGTLEEYQSKVRQMMKEYL